MKLRLTFLFSTLIFALAFNNACFASAPYNWQMILQTPASPLMEDLHWLHNFLLVIITSIVLIVVGLLGYVCIKFNAKANPVPAKFSHNALVEVIWTVIPVLLLIVMAVPSFRILRKVEKPPAAEMIVKVVGYQWYWHYIYPDHNNLAFDSYMLTDAKLQQGQLRLLEVDNRVIIPENTHIKFIITAGDVIHSFAVPSLGIKTDAVPGKVNETWTIVAKKGVYYGQCSELCGVNHGFMPIAIEVVSKEDFAKWLETAKAKFAAKAASKVVSSK